MIDIEHLSDDKYQKVREECDNRSTRRKKSTDKQT